MNSKKLPSGRLAGVDYGRRRIGIAICDAERMIASPLLVHKTTGDRQSDAVFFLKLVEQEEIVGFVVGLPIHSDGRNSEMSSEVEKFANWLSGITKRPIVFQDERHTSQEASGLLRPARLTRGRKKERHDAVAAQVESLELARERGGRAQHAVGQDLRPRRAQRTSLHAQLADDGATHAQIRERRGGILLRGEARRREAAHDG